MKYLLRAAALLALLTFASGFRGCPRKRQEPKREVYQAVPTSPCFIVVNENGDVTERCP
jgi:hypothetical protein